MTQNDQILYAPITPIVETAFWHNLAKQKIDKLKLDNKNLPMKLEISCPKIENINKVYLNFDSFNCENDNGHSCSTSHGQLKNENTIEDFKKSSKQNVINDFGSSIFSSNSNSGIDLENLKNNPNQLYACLLYTFIDLKKWHFSYWFAFASLSKQYFDHSLKLLELEDGCKTQQIHANSEKLIKFQKIDKKHENFRNFFILREGEVDVLPSRESLYVEPSKHKPIFCFLDTSTFPKNISIVCRNYAYFIKSYYGIRNFKILAVRSEKFENLLLEVSCAETDPSHGSFNFTGWTKNSQNKLKSQTIDLSTLMDKKQLATQAANLNLKLMKWRVAPNLDLEKIQNQSALLLGAGTLGSNVARNLLGWGVKKITFLDCGKVSYSNPVRQSLYNFEDVGKLKAPAAVEAVRKISPEIEVEGLEYLIPMPDHPSSVNYENSEEKFKNFENLIKNHDIIFLLTDTRESRWLPALLGKFHNKIVINSALGFDSLVVMRHGSKIINKPDMACYFCQDVVAPQDSTTNRTLDQQCTVSRPGLSYISSGLAVELAMSSLTETLGNYEETPQQIRIFLSNYNQVLVKDMKRFDMCTACGDGVMEAYGRDGFGFVKSVCDGTVNLEDISGLVKLQNCEVDIDCFSDDDF